MNRRTALLLAGSAIVSGCSVVGPDFVRPKASLTSQFVGGGSTALSESATLRWWQELNDHPLNELVERGLQQNLTIEAGIERIRQADAELGRTGLNAQTTGSIGAQLTRQNSETRGDFSDNSVSVNGNYVFDLFGGIRRGREQAIANFEAAQFDVGTVRLAFLFDIVEAYVQARFFQAADRILRGTAESRRRTLSLVMRLRDGGEATALDVARARTELSTARAQIPLLKSSFESNVFRIATLLAEPAGPLLSFMKSSSKQPLPNGIGKQGVPADLLRNRPDIRNAEKNLAAATAAIGVSEAALYPSLTLNGSIVEGSFDSWSFGPSLQFPLLNRGLLKANRNVAISLARQANIGWRNAVLVAVEEVQSGLTTTKQWALQLAALREARAGSGEVLSLSRESYQAGGVILTDVLEAERLNSVNDLDVAEACREYAISWAQLQVASGKGWSGAEQGTPFGTIENAPPSDAQLVSN